MLDRETLSLVTRARTLGDGPLAVYLHADALLRLCAVAISDLNQAHLLSGVAGETDLSGGYYAVPISWFEVDTGKDSQFYSLFDTLSRTVPDFPTYFKCLCEIHKRRLKFKLILQHQPVPKMEQIVPRSLLEYGLRPPHTLASWLTWRKWLYDIDNRSAQETGYLFEPILTASLGGVAYSATRSPVKRTSDASKGRQVDCIVERRAYEFKMRVTIAASGQGRFKEELDFARDCQSSGYEPILLVLDPTPSGRLDELSAEYGRYGGSAFIGEEAWRHLEQDAGSTMGVFVDRYVRTPLREVASAEETLQPLTVALEGRNIAVTVGAVRFEVSRPSSDSPYLQELLETTDEES